MPLPFYVGPPGVTTFIDAVHRCLFLQPSETFLAGGKLIDGTVSRDPGNVGDPGVLRAGLLMGKLASGKYAPSIIDTTIGAYTSGGTTLTVSLAGAAEIIRRVGSSGVLYCIGPPSANGTVAVTSVTFSAVDAVTTGNITVSSLGVNKVAGSFITTQGPEYLPVTMIDDWTYGIQVIDASGNSISAVDFARFPVSGIINSPQILPVWPTDTSLQAWIFNNLNTTPGGKFISSSNY
jgi:hypothetical protein